MKVLEKNLKKGIVKVLPESLDDLWHLYNILEPNDEVYARTTREVKSDEPYGRPKKGRRVSVFLGIRVWRTLWDRSLNRLRVHGVVCEAPEDIHVTGSHHTINVTVNEPITIVKREWAKHHLDRLERASKVGITPIIILSMDDEEYCIGVLRQYGIDVRVEERTRLPGKLEADRRAEALKGFFKVTLRSLRDIWTMLHGPIVIIGPGFIKEQFFTYLKNMAPDIAKAVIDVKGVGSGGLSGIHEAMRSGVLTKALKHVRILEETRLVEEVLARLGGGKMNVTYGFDDVKRVSEIGAVEKLLLADVTLRKASDEERGALERLIREVEKKGGQVVVVSTEHEAGRKLLALGGVAALLRFSVD